MSQNRGNRVKPTATSFEYVYIAYEVQPFDIDEYIQNPAMIKKLYEEMRIARAASTNLQDKLKETNDENRQLELQVREKDYKINEKQKETERLLEERKLISTEHTALKNQVEQLRENNHQQEIQKRELEIELRTLKEEFAKSRQSSLLEYVVSLVAAIVLGFGVNIITTTPNDWKGWVIIGTSIILAVIAFFMHGRGANG